ncbi:MAG: addiction module protein [Rhodoferax sp.]|nr:addiction module protein [Rhodoferax sp.]
MGAVFDELSSKAMALSPVERARLADLMVESLDQAPLTDIDQAWIQLAQQRAEEVRTGTAKTYDADDVIAEARRSIGR